MAMIVERLNSWEQKDPPGSGRPALERRSTSQHDGTVEVQMNSIVIYSTRYGNTEQIAKAVANELGSVGPVRLVNADQVTAAPQAADFVVVGGPTEAHRMTRPLAMMFDRFESKSLAGVATAAFDTRLQGPGWLTGSAAARIARHLDRLGGRAVTPPESFFVARPQGSREGTPALNQGELERARSWAADLAGKVASPMPAGR
jgi:flavodoxin